VGSAEAGLFRGRPYLLTPGDAGEMETPAAREFVEWIRKIGAEPRVMAPERHDRVVALSSHLPQLLSTALASTLAAHEQRDEIASAAGPGLQDSTRLAMSAWGIWRDILETNDAAILEALDLFAEGWRDLREDLKNGRMEKKFRAGAEFAEGLRKRD